MTDWVLKNNDFVFRDYDTADWYLQTPKSVCPERPSHLYPMIFTNLPNQSTYFFGKAGGPILPFALFPAPVSTLLFGGGGGPIEPFVVPPT